MTATVDALLPLTLLEAVREVDTPESEPEAEYVSELRNKRLGLSDTVYAQIRRYTESVKKNQRLPAEEAAAIARLIGRRADAEGVFRAAGHLLAAEMYSRVSAVVRWLMGALPGFLARPVALRATERVATRYFNGSVSRVGSFVLLSVSESPTADSAPRSAGCTYYESAFGEILRRFLHGGGAVEHVRCLSRGEQACEWRAEWRGTRQSA